MTEPAVPPDDQSTKSASSITNVSGGANVNADEVQIGGDVVGRDKITHTEQIDTGGGAVIQGSVTVEHDGAFVGHDKKDIRAETYIEQATFITPAPTPSPIAEAPAPGEPPFMGLQYFDEADADLFFGREELTAQLAARLRITPSSSQAAEGVGWGGVRFLAVVGASGSGKSSLVRAGMIPALRREHPHWQIHLITPTAHPIKELAASLTREVESVTATATLIDDLERDARSLDLAAAKVLKQSQPGERLLLIVDQFEELFTACKDENEQRAFVDNLMHAVAPETNGPVIVVITLRADFYAHCARFDLLRQALEQHQAYIGPMSVGELRRAIEEPAQRADWHFQAGLVDLLLHDVGNEPGALPLLSHALLATWQRRRGRTLTLQGYTEAGGVNGAIAKTADEVMKSLDPEQQVIARNIFLRLTELGEGTQDTRRRAALSELTPRADEAAATEQVLKTLADARLITTGEGVAEVAHEALIREWPTLRTWLDEDREGLRIQRQLTEDAQEWLALQCDDGALYRGTRLDLAIYWADDHADDLNPLEREFFNTSMALRQREETERDAIRQRELDDARKLAEAEARRAKSEEQRAEVEARERRRLLRLAGALGVVSLIAVVAAIIAATAWQRSASIVAELETTIAGFQDAAQLSRALAASAQTAVATSGVGITRTRSTEGMTMVYVPAGIFKMGSDTGGSDEKPMHYVTLYSFWIDRTEVTNALYAKCVAAGKCQEPSDKSSATRASYYDDPKFADYPVIYIDWEDARRYCAWAGGQLPTEAQWEYAARGPQSYTYPWGNDPLDDKLLNYNGNVGDTTAVGSYPQSASWVGALDMAGNVWEWVNDWYGSYPDSAQTNPTGPTSGGPRVLRGGSWYDVATYVRTANRDRDTPDIRDTDLGFRCAAGPGG